jgi:hypothetical protein
VETDPALGCSGGVRRGIADDSNGGVTLRRARVCGRCWLGRAGACVDALTVDDGLISRQDTCFDVAEQLASAWPGA